MMEYFKSFFGDTSVFASFFLPEDMYDDSS